MKEIWRDSEKSEAIRFIVKEKQEEDRKNCQGKKQRLKEREENIWVRVNDCEGGEIVKEK